MGLRTVTKRVVQLAWLFTLGGVLSYAFHAADGDPSQFGAATYAGSWLFCAIVLTVLYWAVVVPISFPDPKDLTVDVSALLCGISRRIQVLPAPSA